MGRDRALTREQQIALMDSAKTRMHEHMHKWASDLRHKQVVHRFDNKHHASQTPKRLAGS